MATTNAYQPGSSDVNTGTGTPPADLKRDITLDVLLAKERQTRFADLIRIDTIGEGAYAGAFIVEGKEDATNGALATYPAGTQVKVNSGTQDEIIIPLDRPQYESRRIDRWDEAVARYDTLAMNVRQLGTRLANAIDRKIAAAIEAASVSTKNLAGNNGVSVVVKNVKLNGGASAVTGAELLGKELIESIYAGMAQFGKNDIHDPVFVAVSPEEFQYLPQALTIVSTDYTSNNGGLDIGDVKMVGGATVFTTNNLPATAGLIGLMFTSEAAGMVKLWDIKIDINPQPEFLNAKLINAYFSNGVAALRNVCAISIKNV